MPDPDELPTLPPPPRGAPPGLRWASLRATGRLPVVPPAPGTPERPSAAEPPARSGPDGSPAGLRQPVGGPVPPPPPAVAAPGALSPTVRLPVAVPTSSVGPGTEVLAPLAAGRPPAGRRRQHLVAALVAGLAVALAAGGLALALSKGGHPQRREPTDPAAISQLVTSLSGADLLARQAVSDACVEAGPGPRPRAVSRLEQAEARDRAVLATVDAGKARLTSWPVASGLLGPVAQVAEDSLVAEGDYASWLAGLEATGCYSAPRNNLYFERALVAVTAQVLATRKLLSAWLPVARHYGLSRSAFTSL